MRNLSFVLFMLFLVSSLLVSVADDKKPVEKPDDAHLKKPFADPPANPKLPNVLLIGDSISIGYTIEVRKLLEGKANVYRVPDNCGPSEKGVVNIKKWLRKDIKWDVIHFNHGIWDTHWLINKEIVKDPSQHKPDEMKRRCTTEKYIENLSKEMKSLSETKAKLIFATTTPFVSYGEDTKELISINNKEAIELMKKEGVKINDLFSLAFPNLKEWQSPDGCHYNAMGYAALGKQVANEILQLLPKN